MSYNISLNSSNYDSLRNIKLKYLYFYNICYDDDDNINITATPDDFNNLDFWCEQLSRFRDYLRHVDIQYRGYSGPLNWEPSSVIVIQ